VRNFAAANDRRACSKHVMNQSESGSAPDRDRGGRANVQVRRKVAPPSASKRKDSVRFAATSALSERTLVVPFVKAKSAQQRVKLPIVGSDQRVLPRRALVLIHIVRVVDTVHQMLSLFVSRALASVQVEYLPPPETTAIVPDDRSIGSSQLGEKRSLTIYASQSCACGWTRQNYYFRRDTSPAS
jgi:hypothetical protein